MKCCSKKILFFLSCIFNLIHCANIFEPLSPKDTNPALLYEARKSIDEGKYIEALGFLGQIDSDFASQNEVRVTYASAYAGACGLEFIPFFNAISQTTFPLSDSLFKFFRSSFTDKITLPINCIKAEMKLKEIGSTAALRLVAMDGKQEVNMLMAVLSMAKIGSILRTTSDVDGTNLLGDGTTDVGFSVCNSTQISDSNIIEIATGFKLLIENLPAILGNNNNFSKFLDELVVGDPGPPEIISPFKLVCGLDPITKCLALDKEDIATADSSEFIDTYRDILENKNVGIGSCDPLGNPDCCP